LKTVCSSNLEQVTIQLHKDGTTHDSLVCSKADVGTSKIAPSSSSVKGSIVCPDVSKICVDYGPSNF
jgi:hypothetical protein